MITIICIGAVIALTALAVVLKTGVSKPQKAQKAEKAAIMKQLLALSDGVPATAPARAATLGAVPAARANSTPRTRAQKRAAKHLPKPVIRAAAQPVHPNQGRC